MNNKILVTNDNLQSIINSFIIYIKENLGIDLNEENISDYKCDHFYNLVNEYFIDYEFCNYKLFILAGALYKEGFNILDKAIEFKNNNPIIINELLKEYILEIIENYQQKLKNKK